jgi:hypothetical protein
VLWGFTSRDEIEIAQANHREWVEQVQETQRPRMSFGEAAARYVGSLPPPIEPDDAIPYDRFYQDQDKQFAEDPLVAQARAVETALALQHQQELQQEESASRAHDEGDWQYCYKSREEFERAKQEASDYEYAKQLTEDMQAGNPDFSDFIDYDPAGTAKDEQEAKDRLFAQRLACEEVASCPESAGPRTRAHTGLTHAVVEDSEHDEANDYDPSVGIIRLATAGPEDLDIERSRYDAAKRETKEDSIG